MFSGFGGFGKKDDSSNSTKPQPSSPLGSGGGSGNNGGGKSIHGFDPESLERAARAAKELDSSKNASSAIKIIHEQEITRQKESEMKRAEFMAYQEQLAIQKLQESEKIAKSTLEEQTRHDRARAEYRDQLERKRMVDQINAQRHLQEEERKKVEDSLRRQEEIRRKTFEYEAQLRQQTELARVKAETEGRILQERENHDLILDRKRLEAKEYRDTVLEGIKLTGNVLGTGFNMYLSDREKLINTSCTITAIAFGIYASRASAGVMGKYIESRLGKPSLIRETSRINFLELVQSPWKAAKKAFKPVTSLNALQNTVFEKTLENRLKRVAISTTNTRKNKAPFRNLLLAGPPGTGKTLFAKGLARQSGLHYAIMTGGDVAPLGKDAVTEIHSLFEWANTTNKGVLLFVDEADAFLRKRSVDRISEDLRNALNAFLYRTGEASDRVMLVFASNQPEQFDWAINDRIDDIIVFGLPKYEERVRILKQYIEEYIINPKLLKPIQMVNVDPKLMDTIAHQTEGYSGREISKLVIAWQAGAHSNTNATLDEDLMRQIFNESKQSKERKQQWLREEEKEALTRDAIP